MLTYNINNHIKDLTNAAKISETIGNTFLAACYRQAAERKLEQKINLDAFFDSRPEITADTRTLRNGRTVTKTATREFRINEEIICDDLLCFDTEEVEEEWEETFGESRCPENFKEQWYDYCSEYN